MIPHPLSFMKKAAAAAVGVGALDALVALGEVPTWADSLGLLFSTYAGPLIRVRRSSDNATMDVYPTEDGDLDEAAMLAWAAGSPIFQDRRYNQIDGTYVEQTTQANQPLFVAAAFGSLGGFAGDGNNDSYFGSSLYVLALPFTVYVVYLPTVGAQTSQRSLWGIGNSGSSNYFDIRVDPLSTTGAPRIVAGTPAATQNAISTGTMLAGTTGLVEARFLAADDHRIRLDGADEGVNAVSITPTPLDQHFIGVSAFSTIEHKGYVPEVIEYPGDFSTAARNVIGAAAARWGASVASL